MSWQAESPHRSPAMTTTQTLRTFASSSEARAAGFSTLQWLRAFTFTEHAARITRDAALRDAD